MKGHVIYFGMQLSRFWPLCIYDEHGQKFHWSRTGLHDIGRWAHTNVKLHFFSGTALIVKCQLPVGLEPVVEVPGSVLGFGF